MIEVSVRGKLSLEEVKRRGESRYAEIQEQLEAMHRNRYIAIEVETGDYVLAERRGAAWRALNARYPGSQGYIRKIGEEPEPLLAARAFGGGSLSMAVSPEPKT